MQEVEVAGWFVYLMNSFFVFMSLAFVLAFAFRNKFTQLFDDQYLNYSQDRSSGVFGKTWRSLQLMTYVFRSKRRKKYMNVEGDPLANPPGILKPISAAVSLFFWLAVISGVSMISVISLERLELVDFGAGYYDVSKKMGTDLWDRALDSGFRLLHFLIRQWWFWAVAVAAVGYNLFKRKLKSSRD